MQNRGRMVLSGSFCFLAALMVVLLPLDWLISCVGAAVFHELCHLVAIYLCSGSWQGVVVSSNTARIPLPPLLWWQELLCAIAGPVGGFFLWFLYPVFPQMAVCGLVQSLYNLLPIFPMDGGRVLRCLADRVLNPAYSDYLCEFIGALTKGVLLAIGVFALICLEFGPVPLMVAVSILLKTGKYPCNHTRFAVQ